MVADRRNYKGKITLIRSVFSICNSATFDKTLAFGSDELLDDMLHFLPIMLREALQMNKVYLPCIKDGNTNGKIGLIHPT